ncbi:MAG: hypothetical protein PHY64_10265, partial [Eubacteriales bacterium]|nr:hypothetical protein [Eubacteriales bacterium]
LKREPGSVWYSIYGRKGMMESDRWQQGVNRVHIFQEGGELTEQDIAYNPKPVVDTELSRSVGSHGGGDFYTMHYFLEKVLGRPGGEQAIDVYQALDMALPGILGYQSILNGNIPFEVPDFRDPSVREAYRNENACTNPEIAGDRLLPRCSFPTEEIPDSVYEAVRLEWEEKQKS